MAYYCYYILSHILDLLYSSSRFEKVVWTGWRRATNKWRGLKKERERERERRTRNDNKRLWNVKKERLTMTTMTKWRKINNLLAVRFVRRRERMRCTPQWDFFFSASRHFHVFHSKHFFPFIISAFFYCVCSPLVIFIFTYFDFWSGRNG